MTTHSRGENQTAISFSMTKNLLKQVDARAKSLGLNRSQYLAQLARNDLVEGGAMMLREVPINPGPESAATQTAKRVAYRISRGNKAAV